MNMFVDDYDHNQSVYQTQAKISSNLGSIFTDWTQP